MPTREKSRLLAGSHLPSGTLAMAAIALLLSIAACVVLVGQMKERELNPASKAVLRSPSGLPQLVSNRPFVAMDGENCPWVPASASTSLEVVLRQGQQAARFAAASADTETKASVEVNRNPLRIIRDTYPTYSAIALDFNSDEVFLEDENLFGIKVFNRTENTPPSANFTEPKRVLGGLRTKLEFNCGLYIDPKTGDIYSVANDTVDTMVIFPHDAKGNVAPRRELHTPHGTYGIAVDEGVQELYLTVEHSNAVVVYPKMASGEEKPIRTVEGPQTRMEDPHGIAIDTTNNLMFVSNHGSAKQRRVAGSGKFHPPSITVYALKTSGDTAPLRVIQGPQAQLNWPAALYLDQENGELYVANDAGDSVLVFRETDNGDVAPLRILKGPKSGIKNPTGVLIDTKHQELWVSNMGNHSATVYPRTAEGDTPPLRTIRSAPAGKLALAIGNPGAVGYDSKRDEILVPN